MPKRAPSPRRACDLLAAGGRRSSTTRREAVAGAAARAGARRTAARRRRRAPSAVASVSGRSAVARPPGEDRDGRRPSRRHWMTTLVPSKSKRKRTSRSPASRHGVAQPRLVLGVEQQEAAAAGADQLAAQRAVLPGRARTTRRSRRCVIAALRCFLCVPVLVHQLARSRAGRRAPARAGSRWPSSLT